MIEVPIVTKFGPFEGGELDEDERPEAIELVDRSTSVGLGGQTDDSVGGVEKHRRGKAV